MAEGPVENLFIHNSLSESECQITNRRPETEEKEGDWCDCERIGQTEERYPLCVYDVRLFDAWDILHAQTHSLNVSYEPLTSPICLQRSLKRMSIVSNANDARGIAHLTRNCRFNTIPTLQPILQVDRRPSYHPAAGFTSSAPSS